MHGQRRERSSVRNFSDVPGKPVPESQANCCDGGQNSCSQYWERLFFLGIGVPLHGRTAAGQLFQVVPGIGNDLKSHEAVRLRRSRVRLPCRYAWRGGQVLEQRSAAFQVVRNLALDLKILCVHQQVGRGVAPGLPHCVGGNADPASLPHIKELAARLAPPVRQERPCDHPSRGASPAYVGCWAWGVLLSITAPLATIPSTRTCQEKGTVYALDAYTVTGIF